MSRDSAGRFFFFLAAAFAAAFVGNGGSAAVAAPAHGIAMQGAPALPAGFDHLPYANPAAPKGGTITYGVSGTFDNLNPFIVQGAFTTSRGLWDVSFGYNVFESLLTRSFDEPFTLYGLLAETVETPDDRSWVEFHLNPKARWADGKPVTVDDVEFTIGLLRDKGRPNYTSLYRNIDRFERVGERGFRITFKDASNRELPLLIGLAPVLPKHAIDPERFDKSTLVPIIGSGPYRIAEVDAPNRIVLERRDDYWAKDLPAKRGFDNYDRMVIDYYRDANSMFEAFKKGLYDVNPEGEPSNWLTGYDFPAVRQGAVIKEAYRTGTPKGMRAFVFNTRRPQFADVRVRKAIAMLFDFEWINANLYSNAYVRSGSYFQDSELSALGRPADAKEKALLAPFPGVVSADVMDGSYKPAVTDASGADRRVLRQAADLLKEAGYEIKDGRMIHAATGTPLTFELMSATRDSERLGLAFQRTLTRLGITMTIRTVDAAQYENRRKVFDYDLVQFFWPASLSPGNELIGRWSSTMADVEGSFNFAGAHEPAIDAMIDALLAARQREDFVAAVRALDRVLISGHYVVPLFHLPEQWIAYRSRLAHPDKATIYGYQLPAWWVKPGN